MRDHTIPRTAVVASSVHVTLRQPDTVLARAQYIIHHHGAPVQFCAAGRPPKWTGCVGGMVRVGSGRIVVLEIEVPNLLANLV